MEIPEICDNVGRIDAKGQRNAGLEVAGTVRQVAFIPVVMRCNGTTIFHIQEWYVTRNQTTVQKNKQNKTQPKCLLKGTT